MRLLVLAGLTALYFAAGKLGLTFASVNASASAVWPPTGIALAAFLLLGYRAWPAIFVGAFLVNLTTSGTVLASLGIAGGNLLEGLAGAWLVDRFARGSACFERSRDVLRFAFFAAFLATALSATIGVTCLALGGQAEWKDFGAIWITWWLGDAAGALVVTPPIVLWSRHRDLDLAPRKLAETVATFIAVLAVGVACFAVPQVSRYPLAYLCLPPLAWLALRCGARESSTAIAVLAVIAVFTTEHGLGPFVMGTRNESLLVLQSFMATIALMILPMAALVGEYARAIEERERAGREERRARFEAETASRTKDEFLAMLSHELRNPLQAIGTSTWMLENRRGSEEQAARSLEIIRRQTDNLTRMVNDLLDMARAIAGKVLIVKQAVDVEGAVRHVMEQLRDGGRLERRQVDVEVEPVRALADPTRFEQMLTNLLGNALKFTPPDGHIRVAARREGDDAVVTVEDDGIGIDPELLPRVFEPFVQGKRQSAGREGGLGLGLALVQRLAQLHGGRVEAQSEGPGLGSRFVLTIPCASAESAGAAREGPPVVVVDGGDSLYRTVEVEGHRVVHAQDGRAGVEAALRFRPEVVLVDIGAATPGGLEIARTLRAREGEIGSKLRLVAVLEAGGEGDGPRIVAAGFDGHVTRPVDRAALRRLLGGGLSAVKVLP